MELKYKRGNVIKSALIDYENLTDICYDCGRQDHKFEICPLHPKSFSIKIEKRSDVSSVYKDSFLANKQVDTMEMTIGLRLNPRRRQGSNMGKPFQGNPKDSIVGTTEKITRGIEQGPLKEKHIFKASVVPKTSKGTKGLRPTRWDKQSTSLTLNMMEAQYNMSMDPPDRKSVV